MNVFSLARRARGKSLRYLARRGATEIWRVAIGPLDRARIRRIDTDRILNKLGTPTARSLVSSWRSRGVFLTEQDYAWLADRYRTDFEGFCRELNVRKDRALSREYETLGSGPVRLGDPIDWMCDFKTGYRWPLVASGKLDFALLNLPCDVKIPWELSRLQHLFPLGQWWVLTKDAAVAREFAAQVVSWQRANPVGLGPNWACTMDVALRAVSLVWLAAVFADCEELDEKFWRSFTRLLWQHGEWIPRHLEVGEINGNHFISDALGMLVCGAFFQDAPEGEAWVRRAKDIFEKEIELQIETDGTDIEGSIPYHRLVLEIFLMAKRVLDGLNIPVHSLYADRLKRALGFVFAYITPRGLVPVIGDADDGRVMKFGNEAINDHRYLLAIGAALFPNAAWKARVGDGSVEELAWFLGKSGYDRYASLDSLPVQSTADLFPIGGYAIMRSSTHYLFVEAGPVGLRGKGGHGHNDILSFEWHAFDVPILTDSGAYVYTADAKLRNDFRSTAFHNAIKIDREEVNRFPGPHSLWTLMDDAHPEDVEFEDKSGTVEFSCAHDGYCRLARPARVRRSFVFHREFPAVDLIDSVEGNGNHELEWYFQLAPGFVGVSVRAGLSLEHVSGIKAEIVAEKGGGRLRWDRLPGWFSPTYGVRAERERWRAYLEAPLPIEVTWRLRAGKW